LLADAGSADATRDEQATIAARWHGLHALLAAHHRHEDRFIGPHLQRLAPDLFAQMEREHHALDAATEALDVAARELPERPERALAFYRLLASFVGRYLGHMADEEGPYLRALQAAYSDGELAAIEGALLASIAPDVMGAFLTVMLPGINVTDRVELLEDMRRHAPPPAFAGVCQLAQQVLPGAAWRATQARLSAKGGAIHA
jgi:hypothetical protein